MESVNGFVRGPSEAVGLVRQDWFEGEEIIMNERPLRFAIIGAGMAGILALGVRRQALALPAHWLHVSLVSRIS